MAVQDVRLDDNATAETWAALRTEHTGRRLIVVLGDRANGVSASVTTNRPELPSLTERLQHIPSAGGSKTLHVFEAIIPTFAENPILDSEVLDGGSSPVLHARVAFVVDEAASYTLAEVVSSDSGSSSVTSWDTGETASVPAGDLLIIAAGTTRGTTTVGWNITDAEPPNPGGGTWLLQIEQSGTAANMRTAFAGYAHLTGQSAQTWEDTLTLGTARETSIGLLVFSTGDGGGGATLVIADAEHEQAAEQVSLVQAHTLAIDDVDQGQDADDVNLTVTSILIINDASHEQTADEVTLAGTGTLAVADTTHQQVSGEVVLNQTHLLAVDDADHEQTAEQATLMTDSTLDVGDASHDQTAGVVVLTVPGAQLVDLHFIPLAPEVAHGPGLAPELTQRTALAPELADRTAGEPELVTRGVGEPELGHGDAAVETAHGQPTVELGHGDPGEPEL